MVPLPGNSQNQPPCCHQGAINHKPLYQHIILLRSQGANQPVVQELITYMFTSVQIHSSTILPYSNQAWELKEKVEGEMV